MLRFFRGGGVSQIVVAGIAGAIILVFALEFRSGSGSPTGRLAQECVVKYAGYCVDPKEFFAAYNLVARNVEPKYSRSMKLRQRVLDGFVERELLVAEANRLGIGISEAALNQELENGRSHVSLPADVAQQLSAQLALCPGRMTPQGPACDPGSDFPVRYLPVRRSASEKFDYSVYERQVRITTNRGPREFKEMQEREMIAERMRDLVRQRVRIPESEAFLLYERDRARAVVRSAELTRDWFAKYTVDYGSAAIDKWVSENRAQVDPAWEAAKSNFSAGCPLVSEILVELPSAATDDEKTELRKRIDEAHARIKAGAPFEQVARDLSQGQAAVLGGDVGCVSNNYGVGADEVKKAAEALKPGEVSAVIETPRGFHILRLNGRLDAAKVEDYGRRQVARGLYARMAADEALAKYAEELISRTKGGEKLEDAVASLNASYAERVAKPAPAPKKDGEWLPLTAADKPKFSVSPPFNVSGNPLPDVLPMEPLAAKAFELNPEEVYKTPIATSQGAVVIQLKEKMAVTRDDFSKERANIMRSLQQAKAADAVARYVADLKRAAGDKIKSESRFADEPKQGAEE
jgi:parvulin-like peptidyl-prolyl isomerase